MRLTFEKYNLFVYNQDTETNTGIFLVNEKYRGTA